MERKEMERKENAWKGIAIVFIIFFVISTAVAVYQSRRIITYQQISYDWCKAQNACAETYNTCVNILGTYDEIYKDPQLNMKYLDCETLHNK